MHRQVIEDAYYVGGARFPPSTVLGAITFVLKKTMQLIFIYREVIK